MNAGAAHVFIKSQVLHRSTQADVGVHTEEFNGVRSEAFMALSIQIVVFWVMTACSLASG
jgi:hypothetical protein